METFPSQLYTRDKFGAMPFSSGRSAHSHYFPTASVSKSPQDDLLPELWLTSNNDDGFRSSDSASQYRQATTMFGNYEYSPLRTPGYSSETSNLAFHSMDVSEPESQADFRQPRSLQEYYYQNTYAQEPNTSNQNLQSSLLLREQSLEYAQSLLPHSLLPLTEDNLDKNHKLNPSIGDNIYKSPGSLGRQNSRNESVSSRSSSSSNSSKNQKHLNTQLYKTELCASYIKSGACLYGSKCQFAHGKEELKVVDRPSNWRSKPCANWTQFGSCRYGKRCCFKHEV